MTKWHIIAISFNVIAGGFNLIQALRARRKLRMALERYEHAIEQWHDATRVARLRTTATRHVGRA